MDLKTNKLVRRTAMLGSVTAAYFLLTADYGPPPNVLDPVKGAIKSAAHSLKKFMFNTHTEETEKEIPDSNGVKKES
ncbi:hypothetical protein H6P81_015249 [Aristolochia fimbriata]|uniref:Uncharacterized protein n=1 Tax=Aristolochia fimbriata TaxID=158543 RepID=A0AAV7E5K8_ARIFI|nr:hypothetical protein H6P81_015249 [Aristolochia fimbriata]